MSLMKLVRRFTVAMLQVGTTLVGCADEEHLLGEG
jgi:hypothetical protein